MEFPFPTLFCKVDNGITHISCIFRIDRTSFAETPFVTLYPLTTSKPPVPPCIACISLIHAASYSLKKWQCHFCNKTLLKDDKLPIERPTLSKLDKT